MDADRSSLEIKILLKNLDPSNASLKHKDRLRRLNKFRNYVTASPPPEFYDDDYSLLLLGSESPTATEEEDSELDYPGLMRAAGAPSTDHKDALKRSARPAISLLRYLCCEFDGGGRAGVMGELNGFGAAFCALNVPQLRMARLDVHVGKGDTDSGSRGGSKDDACHLVALVLARHTDTDQDTPKPLKIQDLLPSPACQKEFEAWLGLNGSPDVRRAIKNNISGNVGAGGDGGASSFTKAAAAAATNKAIADEEEEDEEDADVLGAFGKKAAKKASVSGSSSQGGVAPARGLSGGLAAPVFDPDGKPTRWRDTQMASETQDRVGGAIFIEEEREKALAERKKADEAKQRLIGRDPLGIRTKGQFDLREIDSGRSQLIQQLLRDTESAIQAELALASESGIEKVNWLEAQRQSILTLIETKKISGGDEDDQDLVLPSVLPTSPNFDPILFLTLAHGDTSYKELLDSTSRLSRKTDTQVERLQNLVRDNFELFIKCSEGIDVFAENDEQSNRDGSLAVDKLNNRFAKLDALAESCSEKARKSFKPLIDNTNEVRKVQSALAVLQRVAPLMQVPSLMRQHIENANFSAVVKSYRKVLVIDKNHRDVDLLRYVRVKASEAAQDARSDLELILADESSSTSSLLDAVRDLGELLELLEQDEDDERDAASEINLPSTPRSRGHSNNAKPGTFMIDRHVICVRDYPPALACLLLQTTHFSSLVEKAIANAETSTERFFRGEGADDSSAEAKVDSIDRKSSDGAENSSSSQRSRDKRWKYDTLDTRVSATARAVFLSKNWLPRLMQIGLVTQEAEKRRAARQGRKSDSSMACSENGEDGIFTASYVFNSMVRPSLMRLVQHAAFCSLGCANQGAKYRLDATFGKSSPEKLHTLLQSPLPPSQTSKCAFELAELAESIQDFNESMFTIQMDEEGEESKSAYFSPLETCFQLAADALNMIGESNARLFMFDLYLYTHLYALFSYESERRVCIYSFDACARKCSMSASGSGTFDGDSLLTCVQKLSELTGPDKCTSEVEKGCVLVVQKICEGLTNYVKDRSDAARLRVVAECADALNTTIADVVREVSYLTNDQTDRLESNLSAVVSSLEGQMFDVFLESVKRNVASYSRLGLIGSDDGKSEKFPPYLAGSFLAIVRCRAQVERALREATLRRSDGTTYQFLALSTASEAVVENICHELRAKLNSIQPSKADTYAIHVLFLINTLKNYLSEEKLSLAADTKRMLITKASSGGRRTGKLLGDGPEGLTALENLERQGRVYVMCLGD